MFLSGTDVRIFLASLPPPPVPIIAAPDGEGEPIMCADGDESGMRSGGGRDRRFRLIAGELGWG